MENLTILTILKTSGGLGIFLLGMVVMTDGLRSLAGDTIRKALMHFTQSPLSGATTGAIATAILQSSSATTVAAVGFVGAGLLAFPEALGIIFGANIGTTITGWMVALLGFKFNLGIALLPVILLGVMLKLFFKGKLASIGYTIAGFGLIFVGISFLQEGMSGFEGLITPENLPPDSLVGRLKLVLLGIMATVITQSSSAGVAATLTALFANAINFEQAAALIIGMDVGTTVTAAMASIGGSVNVKRTGLSHVVYNIFTAVMALFLITPYTTLWEYITSSAIVENAEIALVAFHTLFNTLGALIILPFTPQFAQMMQKLIPSNEPRYTTKLDQTLLKEPSLALEVARISTQDQFMALLHHVNFLLGDVQEGKKTNLILLHKALIDTQVYLDDIDLKEQDDAKWKKLIALIHILDHENRIHDRCEEDGYRAQVVQQSMDLENEMHLLVTTNTKIINAISSKQFTKAKHYAKKCAKHMKKHIKPYREMIAKQMAEDKITMQEGTRKLEAMRWLLRVTHHFARITEYLEESVVSTAK